MTYLKSWEEFERAAERLYLQDPMKVLIHILFQISNLKIRKESYESRFTMKYVHSKQHFSLKMTDDVVCLQFKTDMLQDLKK